MPGIDCNFVVIVSILWYYHHCSWVIFLKISESVNIFSKNKFFLKHPNNLHTKTKHTNTNVGAVKTPRYESTLCELIEYMYQINCNDYTKPLIDESNDILHAKNIET